MLSTSQVAHELGVTVRRVQALIASGRLAATKLGRDWFVEPKALTAVRDRRPGRPPLGRKAMPGNGKKNPKKSG